MTSSKRRANVLLHYVIPLLILGVGIGGTVVLFMMRAAPASAEKNEPPPLVEYSLAEGHPAGLDILADGLVVPYREIQVSAEVAGRVVTKSEDCEAGRYVERGDLLIEIDPADYELELKLLDEEKIEAEVTLDELKKQIEQTEEQRKLAEDRWRLADGKLRRQEDLLRGAIGATSQVAVDDARSAEIAARNEELALRQQKSLLETRQRRMQSGIERVNVKLDQARLALQRTSVVAPTSGVILSESIEQDGFVQPGGPLFKIEDTSKVEVKCSLKMEELARVWKSAGKTEAAESPATGAAPAGRLGGSYDLPNTPVKVIYEIAGRRFQWQGRLARYDGLGLDEKTRTVPCRVVVDDPRAVTEIPSKPAAPQIAAPPALMRGMFVTLLIETSPPEDATYLSLPERSLQPGKIIWVVRPASGNDGGKEDGGKTVRELGVRLAGVAGDRAIVTVPRDAGGDGLQAGDHVVLPPFDPKLAEAVARRSAQEDAPSPLVRERKAQ